MGQNLGSYLRHEREKRGITVEQVASATKINVKLLHALESDHYIELPAMPFVRGFVSSYARFIGLDPKDVAIQFEEFLHTKSRERPANDSGHIGYAFEKKDTERSKMGLWIAMTSIGVMGALGILVVQPILKSKRQTTVQQLKEKNSQQAKKSESTTNAATSQLDFVGPPAPSVAHVAVAPSPAVTPGSSPVASPQASPQTVAQVSPAPSPSVSPAASPSPSPSATTAATEDPFKVSKGDSLKPEQVKHKVVLQALADVWIRFKIDNFEATKFILLTEKYLVLKGEREIAFQVSNPKAVKVKYQNGAYSVGNTLANKGVVNETVTFSYPSQGNDIIEKIFKNAERLPATADPSQQGAVSED